MLFREKERYIVRYWRQETITILAVIGLMNR